MDKQKAGMREISTERKSNGDTQGGVETNREEVETP